MGKRKPLPFSFLLRRGGGGRITSRWRFVLYYGAPIWALALTFGLASLLLILVDVSPGTAFSAIWDGAFGTRYAFGQSLTRATPLILTALVFLLSFRCGLFNLGAEGQLQVGGLCASLVAVYSGNVVLAALCGIVGGAALGAVPGYLLARLGVNEIISTLMLNFIAMTVLVIIVIGPFHDPAATYPTSPPVPEGARLPIILSGSPLHAGLLIALAVTVVVTFLLYRTPIGFRIRAVGLNSLAARHSGINVLHATVFTMAFGGAIAGLAGAIEVLGVQFRVAADWSAGWGFIGIPIAFLAAMKPMAVIPVAFLYGALEAGAQNMQIVTGVPGALITIMQALPILFLVAIWGMARPETLRVTPPDEEELAAQGYGLQRAESSQQVPEQVQP